MTFASIFFEEIKFIVPEIFFIFSVLTLLCVGIFLSSKYLNIYKNNYRTPYISTIINNLFILSLIFVIILLCKETTLTRLIFDGMYTMNYALTLIELIILIISVIYLLSINNFLNTDTMYNYEYLILLYISIFSILLTLHCNSFLHLYITLEMQSFCFYVLASSRKSNLYSCEAGLKYFITGSLISGFLLFGIALLYGTTGLTNLTELSYFFTTSSFDKLTFTAICFILSAFFFKLTIAPFHVWAPDVYEGAPSIITMFFNIAPKFALIALLSRILMSTFYAFIDQWQLIFILVSLLSIIVSAFFALQQYKIKRFLTYSSVTHIGYMILGLSTGTIQGVQSLLFYFIVYLITTIAIWAILLIVNNKVKYITDFADLFKNNYLLGISLTIIMFSMAGIPPLAGFLAKFYTFFVCVENNVLLPAIFAIVISVITAFYYIRFIKIMYFESTNNNYVYTSINKNLAVIISAFTLVLVFLCLNPNTLFIITHYISLFLCL
ncbi:hypothetical protein WA158_002656 [Blastocystis sp. Blastoise]